MPRRSKSVKRSNRRANRRTIHRRRRGGALSLNSALPYSDFEAGLGGGDLKQGQEFLEANKAMHGGAALGGADYADAYSGSPLIPADMAGAARTAALDASFKEIAGMKDMEGGRRRRASRKARSTRRKGRKARKASRKGRKASRKARKASRKARKASRKGRKASRKSRRSASRKMRGGAAVTYSPAEFGAKEMLLDSYEGAGLSSEWKTAENPDAYAPKGVDTYRPE
jgi:hypothetical protein